MYDDRREETIEEKVKRLGEELEVREGQLVMLACVILKAEQDYEDSPNVMKVCKILKESMKFAKEALELGRKLSDGVPYVDKLHGEELDKEIEKRKGAQERRRENKKTLRTASKEQGIPVLALQAYERGEDVCPHEEYKKFLGCIHPPFFVIERCTKCRHIKIIGKEEDVSEEVLEEAFQNSQREWKSQKRITE